MIYILIVAITAAVPLVLGIRFGKPVANWCRLHQLVSAAVVIACALAWLGAAYWARSYADGDGAGWSVAEWLAHCGKWYVFSAMALCLLGVATQTGDLGRARKVALVVCDPAYGYCEETSERFRKIWQGKTAVFRVREVKNEGDSE